MGEVGPLAWVPGPPPVEAQCLTGQDELQRLVVVAAGGDMEEIKEERAHDVEARKGNGLPLRWPEASAGPA